MVRPISTDSSSCTLSALAVRLGTITGRMVMDWLAVYCFPAASVRVASQGVLARLGQSQCAALLGEAGEGLVCAVLRQRPYYGAGQVVLVSNFTSSARSV